MERTVPSTESEEIELYLRTYYSLLRSTAEVQIRTLEEVHAGMRSLLHPGARRPEPDMSAFIYSLLRLPRCVSQVKLVVLGQSAEVFARGGYGNVYKWEKVSADARRRGCFFDGKDTLACMIASRSDIDDLLPTLTAYQIEWNKMHEQLSRLPDHENISELCGSITGCSRLAEILEVSLEDVDRLVAVWDKDFPEQLQRMAEKRLNVRVQLLSGSLSHYRRATDAWWRNIEVMEPSIRERPVYFVSSNVHSLFNLLTGFPLQAEAELVDYLQESGNTGLLNEWNDILDEKVPSSKANFLYYVYKKYEGTPPGRRLSRDQYNQLPSLGISWAGSEQYLDVDAQVFELAKLDLSGVDPRLQSEDLAYLVQSDALILNVDYPLGMAAYNILSEVADNVGSVQGVYVMGKAATLNGVVGDVMVPNVVHDEHSQNTFLYPNCFSAADVGPYLNYGTVLDNQKAVTVRGTFLQNDDFMDVFYREGYTDIEMESGPYLSAVYEMYRPTRHPANEIVNLYGIPFDLGILHYASDRPMDKGKNLGAGSLSYFGIDATYATALAILKRIIELESRRMREQPRRQTTTFERPRL